MATHFPHKAECPAIPEPLMPRIFDFFYLDFLEFFAGKNREVSLRDPSFK